MFLFSKQIQNALVYRFSGFPLGRLFATLRLRSTSHIGPKRLRPVLGGS